MKLPQPAGFWYLGTLYVTASWVTGGRKYAVVSAARPAERRPHAAGFKVWATILLTGDGNHHCPVSPDGSHHI